MDGYCFITSHVLGLPRLYLSCIYQAFIYREALKSISLDMIYTISAKETSVIHDVCQFSVLKNLH
jgi:hypothetical protein